MTDRRAQFFMAFTEVDEWLADVTDRVVMVSEAGQAPRLLEKSDRVPPSAQWVYVGLPGISHGTAADVNANPGKFGWVRFNTPRVHDDALLKTQLDIRTTWLDHDSPDGVTVFERVAKPLRRRLTRPTWAWNISGGPAQSYRDVAYTAGALELFEGGTPWMQEGVLNVRYGPQPVDQT